MSANVETMFFVRYAPWHGLGVRVESALKSPVELWLEKTGQLPYSEAGEAAYWGTQLEVLVRTEFTKRTGIEVNKVNQILQHEDYPFMLANLDGTCQHPNYGTCVFEAKTASAYKAFEWEDKIPDEYMLQIQHYMAVTGYAGTYIAVLIIAAIQLVDIICEMAVTFNDVEIKSIGWTEFAESIDIKKYPELITYLKERRLYINEPVESEEDV